MDYRVTSEVWLSTEEYQNQGLKPDEIRKEIEKIRDGNYCLSCESSGFNHNWIVKTRLTDPTMIEVLVLEIAVRLDLLLEKKKSCLDG